MITLVLGVLASAVLFAVFGLLGRGREAEVRTSGCGCSGQACGACRPSETVASIRGVEHVHR